MTKFELHLDITQTDITVIDSLKNQCQLSTNQIKQAVTKGALWLSRGKYTKRLRRVKKTLKLHDSLHFYYDEKVLNQVPMPAHLIADLNDYSIWYKPYGMLSQGSKWSDHCTIARWAETQLQPQRSAFIVHRLDRAASGLIIIAHSKKSAQAFSKIFEQHQIEKTYHIIVHGDHSSHQQPEKITQDIDDKSACSYFKLIEYNQECNLSLIEVKIETGRKHQIRKHAASINMPVVGDRLHGKADEQYLDTLNLQLCAVKLEFSSPISDEKQSFELTSELKPNLAQIIEQLSQ